MRPIYNVGVVARFEKKKTDACRNDCMSFQKEYADSNFYHICGGCKWLRMKIAI